MRVRASQAAFRVANGQLAVIPVMRRMVQLRRHSICRSNSRLARVAPLPYRRRHPQLSRTIQKLCNKALNHLGGDPQLDVDGNYGRMTRHAVLAFQAAHGLAADGLAGPDTWAAITKAEVA